jgi:hypothetical protein
MSRKKYTAARRLLFLHAEHVTTPGTCGLPPPARDKRLTVKATSSVEMLFSIDGRRHFEAVFEPTAFNIMSVGGTRCDRQEMSRQRHAKGVGLGLQRRSERSSQARRSRLEF